MLGSYVNHNQFCLVNNMIKEYDGTKEEIKLLRLQQFIKDFDWFIKQCYIIVWTVEKMRKVKTQKLKRQIKEE